MQAINFALIFVIASIALSVFVNVFKFKPEVLSVALAAFAGPIVATIIVIIKKKNSFLSVMLMDLIALIGVLVIALLGV